MLKNKKQLLITKNFIIKLEALKLCWGTKKTLEKLIYVTSAFGLVFIIAITIARAWVMDFTYDEAYSFVHRGRELRHVIRINIANNHLLNSILIYCIGKIWAFNEFALRIPNLAMLIFYLATMCSIAMSLFKENVLLFFSCILILLAGYQVFEIFSMARGYGLAAGSISISLYYLLLFKKNGERKFISRSLNWVAIGTIAQLISVFVFTSLLCLYLLSQLHLGKKNIDSEIRKNWIQYLLYIIALALFLLMGSLITGRDAPIYSSSSTNESTISALIGMGEFISPLKWMWPLMILTIAIFWLRKLSLCYKQLKKAGNVDANEIFRNFILDPRTILILALGIMLLAGIFHKRGIIAGREIVPMTPVIIISFWMCIAEINLYLSNNLLFRRIFQTFLSLFSILVFALGIANTRVDKTYSYEENSDDRGKIESAAKLGGCVQKNEVGFPIMEFYNLKNNTKVKYCED